MQKSEKLILLLKYYTQHQSLPAKNEEYKGFNIYAFVKEIRNSEITLYPSELKQLKSIGIVPYKEISTVHEKLLLLTEFFGLADGLKQEKFIKVLR